MTVDYYQRWERFKIQIECSRIIRNTKNATVQIMIIINAGRDLEFKSNVLEELGTPNRNGSNHAQLSFFTSLRIINAGRDNSCSKA
jgi:hypothetical protein